MKSLKKNIGVVAYTAVIAIIWWNLSVCIFHEICRSVRESIVDVVKEDLSVEVSLGNEETSMWTMDGKEHHSHKAEADLIERRYKHDGRVTSTWMWPR